MTALPLSELGVTIGQLGINGPGGDGYEPLLRAIARRYRVSHECVVSAIGTSMANYLALAAVTAPGDEVLIERPAYEPLLSTARYLGLSVSHFQRPAAEEFQVDLAELKRGLSPRTRVIVITNLHNPTGALCSRDSLQKIADLAHAAGAYLLVDEVYLEMLFEPEPDTAFHLDPDRLLITNSLTKAYGLSGLRCGWVIAPPEIAQRIWRINDLHGVASAHPAELLSVVALEKLAAISSRMKSLLDQNRELLRQFLASRADLDCYWPDYGTMAFPRLRNGDVDQMCQVLRERFDTSVVPGHFFDAPGHFRIGVGETTESVREALEQLGKGLDYFANQNLKRSASPLS